MISTERPVAVVGHLLHLIIFSDELMRQASFSNNSGLYCYPGLNKDNTNLAFKKYAINR